MNNRYYRKICEFNCCENIMVTVIIESRAVCVMSEGEYNRIIKTEQKFRKNKLEKLR